MSQIANTIAGQLHHMKPDVLEPGRHVAFQAADDALLILFTDNSPIHPGRICKVTYLSGPDLYNVRVKDELHDPVKEYDRVFCDQLGELVWGDEAKRWTQRFGAIINPDDGTVISEW